MNIFKFKRKNKEGKEVEQPVTQEEFDTLEANSATLARILELFGTGAQAEDFDVVNHIEEMATSLEQVAEAFGEEAEADDFDAAERITTLLTVESEMTTLGDLLANAPGATVVDKVKAIKPAGKTTTKKGSTKPETTSAADAPKRWQDYPHNAKMAKELLAVGVTLDNVDYATLN